MSAYYNEIDPFAAAWLRELIKADLIAPGEVDERDIQDVCPTELRGFRQCHFFAGIGVWSYALRLAGWPDDEPVWTASCPCGPFSSAGLQKGFRDERHLWPVFYWHIRNERPGTIFGEQVATGDGPAWIDLVAADLDAEAYSFRALDLCSAGFGAPHIRPRFYWVADSKRDDWGAVRGESRAGGADRGIESRGCRDAGWLAEPNSRGRENENALTKGRKPKPLGAGLALRLEHPNYPDWRRRSGEQEEGVREAECGRIGPPSPGPTNGYWSGAQWVWCQDQVYRPIEPGTCPLAYGSPARVGRLRGYGNAICAPAAEAFIRAYMQERG